MGFLRIHLPLSKYIQTCVTEFKHELSPNKQTRFITSHCCTEHWHEQFCTSKCVYLNGHRKLEQVEEITQTLEEPLQLGNGFRTFLLQGDSAFSHDVVLDTEGE